jgi:hypothetical protein
LNKDHNKILNYERDELKIFNWSSLIKYYMYMADNSVPVVRYSNGDEYEGSFLNKKRHGRGQLRFVTTGEEYTGEFDDDRIHGQGVYKFRDGSVYTGYFQHNMKHGNGEMRYSNGDIYVGFWRYGKRHGKGIAKYSRGIEYDIMRGGKVKFGACYDGEWENDKRHGKGIYRFSNGDVFKGTFKYGRMHGYGEYRHGVSGDYYEGEFVNGLKCGIGTLTLRASSTVYFGEFKDGHPSPSAAVYVEHNLDDISKRNRSLFNFKLNLRYF